MSAIVKAAVAASIALVARERDAPVAPFGYGRDMSCTSDLAEDMGDVDPISVTALGEALMRRIDCPRGGMPDDPNYGIDIRGALNRGVTREEALSWRGRVRTEWLKDDRVLDAAVEIAWLSSDGREMSLVGIVTPADPALGKFSLTLALTSADVLIQEIARV
jgi:hypothetical protein